METTEIPSLLDLPREILEEVIKCAILARSDNLRRILRLRLICKMIDPIVMDMLYRAPFLPAIAMTRVKAPRKKEVKGSEAAFWSEFHVRKAVIGSSLPMYSAIRTLVDNFCDISNTMDDHGSRQVCFATVCNPRYMAYFAPRRPGFEQIYPFGPVSAPDDTIWLSEQVQTRGLLLMCCLFNDLELLEEILRKQPEDDRGRQEYLIRIAARSGNVTVIEALFDIKYRIHKPKLEYLLSEAALGGSTEVLELFSRLDGPFGCWRGYVLPSPLVGITSPEFLERYMSSHFYGLRADSVEEDRGRFPDQVLRWCAHHNHVDVISYISKSWGISRETREDAIAAAAEGYSMEALRYLIQTSLPVSASRKTTFRVTSMFQFISECFGTYRQNPLQDALVHAAGHGSLEMLKLILNYGGSACLPVPAKREQLVIRSMEQEHIQLFEVVLGLMEVDEKVVDKAIDVADKRGLESMHTRLLQEKTKCRLREVNRLRFEGFAGILAIGSVAMAIWSRPARWKSLLYLFTHGIEILGQTIPSLLWPLDRSY